MTLDAATPAPDDLTSTVEPPRGGAAGPQTPPRPAAAWREGTLPSPSELIRLFLHGRDVACPGCTYNLRDLLGDRCPECGQVIVLNLQLAEPRQAALLTGLIGLSAGAGLNGLLLIYYVLMLALMPYGPPDNDFLWTILIGFAVHAGALAMWLRSWRRIRLAPTRWRSGLAAACCVMPLVDIVIFAAMVR